jgi:murein DD-endopeptidase MepM/ murein hydrolase activator NlpD
MLKDVLGEIESTESKALSVESQEEIVEVKDYIAPSKLLFTAFETAIVAKDLAIDTAKATKETVLKTKNGIFDLKESVVASDLYSKIVRLSQSFRSYFQVRGHCFSYCQEQLQLCLYECVRMNSDLGRMVETKATSEIILKQALSTQHRLMRIKLETKGAGLDLTAKHSKPRGLYPKNKKTAIKAFLLTVWQYNSVCLERFRENANKLQHKVLNTAMHLGAMSVFGAYDGKDVAANTAKSTVTAISQVRGNVKIKTDSFVKTTQQKIYDNISLKRKTLRLIGKKVKSSRKLGLKEFVKALLTGTRDVCSVFSGMFKTAFNYAAPALAIMLLINLVTDYAAREYGIALEVGGQQIAVLENDGEYDKAEQIVNSKAGLSASILDEPKYALTLIDDKNNVKNGEQLADMLLENSATGEVSQLYDVTVDGEVIATVADPKPIADALSDRLLLFSDSTVENLSYTKKVEYIPSSGKTANSVGAVIEKLSGYEEKDTVYIAESEDVKSLSESEILESLAQKLGTSPADLKENNASYDFTNIKQDDKIIYTKKDYYLPVVYTKSINSTVPVAFTTITVDSEELYKGIKEVVQEGIPGERSETYSVTYTNGVETSRELVNSETVKSAQTEIIGVGTFVAKPAAKQEVIQTPKNYSASEQYAEPGKYIWPVNGGYISAYMGDGRGHKGLDIAAPSGTEIYSCASGTVVIAGKHSGYSGYGYFVLIDHGDGYQTLYGHMSEVLATAGQEVQPGDCIGLVGQTGWASGNHLHIEVRQNGEYRNPLDFISTER